MLEEPLERPKSFTKGSKPFTKGSVTLRVQLAKFCFDKCILHANTSIILIF